MKSKMRIQLLSDEGVTLSDRLVDQTSEFYLGPKSEHKGPIRVELTLQSQEEVEKSIEYLKKLSGMVPIVAKTTRVTTTKAKAEDLDTNREEFLENTIKESTDQDVFIKTLRDLDYRFLTSTYLKTLIPDKYQIKEKHFDKFDWLVKRTREAKDPRNDRFDTTMLIGITIMVKRQRRMVVYLFGEFHKSYKLDIPEKNPITHKQTNMIKYPHYMLYDERFKWGMEHREMFNNPEKKATRFYKRWVRDVIVPDELKLDPPYESR